MFKKIAILSLISCLFLPTVALAAFRYDLGLTQDDIRIVGGQLTVGKKMNLVARVHNYGSEDVKGYSSFFLGNQLIGDSQVVSILSGTYDDAWVNFTVPSSPFNVRVVVTVQDQSDERPENNENQTSMFTPDIDTDGDGLSNQQDLDDDNDGSPDTAEAQTSTDPLNSDTDGDGHKDGDDAYPLDPTRWAKEEVKQLPLPEVKPPAVTAKPIVRAEPVKKASAASNSQVTASVTITQVNEAVAPVGEVQVLGQEMKRVINSVAMVQEKIGWTKYKFQTDIPAEIGDQFTYLWDFGDGAQSAERLVTHRFGRPGNYLVKLTVEDQNKNVFQDQAEISVSWFNPGNYRLWLLVALLFAIMLGLLASLRYNWLFKIKQFTNNLKNKESYDE